MEVKLFGFTLLKTAEQSKESKSFIPPESMNDDGSLHVSTNFYTTTYNLENNAKSDAELIDRYRDMSIHPEVEIAIDDIVSEAIVNEADQNPVKLLTKNVNQPASVKKALVEEFDNVLSLLKCLAAVNTKSSSEALLPTNSPTSLPRHPSPSFAHIELDRGVLLANK